MDNESNFHFVWNSEDQVLHKMLYRGVFQETISLAENSMPWLGAPTLSGDESGSVYAVWIEDGHMVMRKLENRVWKGKQNLGTLSETPLDFSPKLGRSSNGFDLVWINQPARFTDGSYQMNFYTAAAKENIKSSSSPAIYTMEVKDGMPNVVWKSVGDQKGFRIVMDIKNPPSSPYAYDSGAVDGAFSTYLIKNFDLTLIFCKVVTATMTHNYTTIARTAMLFLLLGTLNTACGTADQKKKAGDSMHDTATGGNTSAGSEVHDSTIQTAPTLLIEAVVFEVRGSNNRLEGYGYDLVINGKKTVHQPMIPAVQGNKSFATEQDAKAVGELAAARMRKTGDLPTISVKDLDSLKITYR